MQNFFQVLCQSFKMVKITYLTANFCVILTFSRNSQLTHFLPLLVVGWSVDCFLLFNIS
jgi:hypothetical protein